MGTYRHPRTRDDVAGTPPARVTATIKESYPVDDDGTFEAPESAAVTIARAYDLTIEAIQTGADGDSSADETDGICTTVKADGDECGRELPCPYHSEADE